MTDSDVIAEIESVLTSLWGGRPVDRIFVPPWIFDKLLPRRHFRRGMFKRNRRYRGFSHSRSRRFLVVR